MEYDTLLVIAWVICGISAVSYLIVSIIFSFKYHIYDFENNLMFSELDNSLNGKLIYNLEFKYECSSDEEAVILGRYDGTIEGCKCKNVIYNYSCEKDKAKKDNCDKLNPISPINYKKINSKYLCAKKSSQTYLDLLKSGKLIPNNEACPSNFTKSCGIIDTLNRKLCVEDTEKCPINIENLKNISLLFNSKNENKVPTDYNGQIISIF